MDSLKGLHFLWWGLEWVYRGASEPEMFLRQLHFLTWDHTVKSDHQWIKENFCITSYVFRERLMIKCDFQQTNLVLEKYQCSELGSEEVKVNQACKKSRKARNLMLWWDRYEFVRNSLSWIKGWYSIINTFPSLGERLFLKHQQHKQVSLQYWMSTHSATPHPTCLILTSLDRHVNVSIHDMGSVDRKEAWLSPCSLREALQGHMATKPKTWILRM